ncbi:MAG: Hexokinase [Pelosinus sp.]|jgi:hexokinase|nr:Hexokinase [Pelosinus sp.]
MSNLLTTLHKLALQLTITPEQIGIIANKFQQAMQNGLAGQPSSLKMLPSYLNKPSRKETGTFLALDFGGTNVRVLLTELLGEGQFTVHARAGKPLKNDIEHYNHISKQSTANHLFDFIAQQIATLIKPDRIYPLGHTFSFPIHQIGLNAGALIHWTKEIETTGVVGKDITALLKAALVKQGLEHVVPQAIINDTVGTLLTSAYGNPFTDIGSICGTGHNTAYLEPCAPWTKEPMIINIESGNFDQLPFTAYDTLLDKQSEKPGEQRLEKMVSGHYIGELVRIIACSLFEDGLLASSGPTREILKTPYLLHGAPISLLLEDDSEESNAIACFLNDNLGILNSTIEDRQALKNIATLVTTRSARLVAATYIGILHHIDPNLTQNHTIAIDGSLYEKTPGYADTIQMTLDEGLATTSEVTTTLTKDGSGIGAAIATAIAVL